MAEELFVARESDIASLNAHYESAKSGKPAVVRLQSPFGGGRRALVGEFLRGAAVTADDPIVWRAVCLDQENGLNWLVRMYGSLLANVTTDLLRRGRIEMILNAQLPAQPKRVQGWFQQFISSMKEAKPDKEKGSIQLKLPQDNPLIGLVEVTIALGRKTPVIIEIQNPNVVYSLALAQFVEAILVEGKNQGAKVLVILHDEPETEATKGSFPMPLVDLYERNAASIAVQPIAAWGADEVTRYAKTKGVDIGGNAARIAEIAGGRPGFIAETVEILGERGQLAGDLSGVSFATLVPLAFEATNLDIPSEPPAEGQRKHAGPEDVNRVVYLAALLGQAFPSGLLADMGGFDRDSVDDMLDAMDDLFEEVQFAQDLGTWIYKFKRGAWRLGILEQNDNEEGHALARRVGVFMERFLMPRGYGFIVKTARLYAEHGAVGRASVVRSIALSNDAPDMWGLSYDLMKYYDEVTWPDPMRRTVLMNLVDRLVGNGAIPTAELVWKDAEEYANKVADDEMKGWLLFAGSRLDLRRQDLFRSRDRARDALAIYQKLGAPMRMAEIHAHMAGIELQDGNPNAALEHVNESLRLGQVETQDGQKGVVPNIAAQAEYVRGAVERRNGNVQQAAQHFRTSNEIAGQAGLGPLALDAGLGFGEALLAGRQLEEARDVLGKVVAIAQQLQNAPRERSACELAAQAEGALRNFDQAIKYATRTLQISQALKFEQVLPIDLYNLGFFNFAINKPTEALTYFRQAEARIGAVGNHPVVKELYYFKGMAHARTGELPEAKRSLNAGIKPAQEAKDWPKVVSALEVLAEIEHKQGNREASKRLLTNAIELARQADLKDARKALKKKFDDIHGS